MEPANIDRPVLPGAATLEAEPAISPAQARKRPFTIKSLAPYGYISPTMLLIIGGRPGEAYSPPIWASAWRGA